MKFNSGELLYKQIPPGDGEDDDNDDNKDLDTKIAEAVARETAALKKKNSELLTKNKSFTDQLKSWEGLDPEKTRAFLKKFEENEELQLLADGKHEEVINRRIERERATWKSKEDQFTAENTELKEKLEKSDSKIRELLIDGAAKDQFVKAGGRQTALDDIVLRARQTFKLEDGQLVARDAAGEIVRGKEGPMTISEWINGTLKKNAPHLFGETKGSGGSGGDENEMEDIDKRLLAAAQSGNHQEYRRLREEQEKGKKTA